jgi:hypothetical protein
VYSCFINAYRVLLGKSVGRRPLRRYRLRREYNIKMDLRDVGLGMWTVFRPMAGSCEHGNEPLAFIKY